MDGIDERRRAPRHRVTFRLVCDDGGTFTAGTVIDISRSGVLVQTAQRFEPGAVIGLVPIGAAGEILFDVKARVARVVELECTPPAYRLGLEFVDIDKRRLAALRRIMAKMPSTDGVMKELEPPPPEPAPPRRDASESHHRIRAGMESWPAQPAYTRRIL